MFALEGGGRGKTETDVAFFFVSYLLINSVMLLNVVVAVLLDEFIRWVHVSPRPYDHHIHAPPAKGCKRDAHSRCTVGPVIDAAMEALH